MFYSVTVSSITGSKARLLYSGAMKISRRTANILMGIGIFTLLVWVTRLFVFVGELQAGTLPAPVAHFFMVVAYLVIGVYLTVLGLRGRRASR
jgi:putative Ca2+/H+ antiporter (TMEM165/GDT1 family)